MTPPNKRKLQIVPYAPNDYKPGEVLALNDATVVTSTEAIGAALSLYFQWEKKRSSHITFAQGSEKKALLCRMDYDHDEASPTEIRVQLQKSKIGLKTVPGSTVLIRFEIFRVTYEFKSVITAVSGDPKRDGWHSILEVPNALRVIKSRHLPRIRLKSETRKLLPTAKWESADKSVTIPLKLLEIGMGSVRAGCQSAPEDKDGHLLFGAASVPVEIVRVADSEVVFKLNFKDHSDFGAYFDYYRLVAYPSLRSRYEIPFEEGIELYRKSNYFSIFGSNQDIDTAPNIIETWKDLKSGFHQTTADFYIVDQKGVPIGCSGLALTNISGEAPIWRFHQLCAIKDPKSIQQSGVLYAWRAEYLLGRREHLLASVSFRSNSRWLERIYVKYANVTPESTQLVPVVEQRHTVFAKDSEKEEAGLKTYRMGNAKRISSVSKDLWAAANPKYLNASANEDMIVAVFRPTTIEELERVGSSLAAGLKVDSLSVVCVTPMQNSIKGLSGQVGASDRFCIFQKSSLVRLISSVEHSIAVTERKLLHE